MGCSPIRCFVTLILSLLMAPRDVGWRWTGVAGGEKRAQPGYPGEQPWDGHDGGRRGGSPASLP